MTDAGSRHVRSVGVGPSKSRILGYLCRFRRDRSGVGIVEFALISVPFLGLMCAIFETGFVFFQTAALQGAVQAAARNALTGTAQASSATVTNAAQFNTTFLCPLLPSFMTCGSVITDIRYLPTGSSFASADVSNDFYKLQPTRYCPGPPGTITIVRVAYPMPVFLPLLAGINAISVITTGLVNDVPGSVGIYKHLIRATMVFQAEPYSVSNYTQAQGC